MSESKTREYARPCLCTTECDCANPEPDDPDATAHCSQECPIHNLYPVPHPECPVHHSAEDLMEDRAIRL